MEFLGAALQVFYTDRARDSVLQFLQSTYDAAADLAKWDRAAAERETGKNY